MGSVAENLAAVEARIKAACTRVGRDPSEVRLLPVSKSQGTDLIAEAYEAGVRLLGENRVQEATEKARHFADHPDLKWAIIGHLQTNKARQVAAIASEFKLPWKMCRGLAVAARAVGLVGHIIEEMRQPMAEEIYYRIEHEATEHSRPQE